MEELRFRQIHMDFHTSEKINTICSEFDADDFASTLESAHVNSVTCFSRCHHGMLYYNSKKFPQLIHPGLKNNKNLLESQIDACHKRGIKVPIYTTVQWDYYMSMNHPEWNCISSDGAFIYRCFDGKTPKVYSPGFYRTLCVNTPYRQFLKDQIEDVINVVGKNNVDGIFLDIVKVVDCSCEYCKKGMLEKGYNPELYEERIKYAQEMIHDLKKEMTKFIHNIKPNISVFYNGSHIGPRTMKDKEFYTHWELESLPSGKWGYAHFGNTVRYARTSGMDYLSHTGKFHTSWGDFHSMKNKEALEYECFRMLAYNSKCLIGDQLHPDGRISPEVYDLIGDVYAQVEKKEPWCTKATEVVELGVLTSEYYKTDSDSSLKKIPDEITGICALLDELGYQFNIIDEDEDFRKYKIVILPDNILCSDFLADKIDNYIADGGRLIASYRSGLNYSETEFAIKRLGISLVGDAPYSPDFLVPTSEYGKRLFKTEYVMYNQGKEIKINDAKEVVKAYIPYFNRTWEHFCSHLHTPSSHKYGYPGITECKGNYYFMHPIFSIYQEKHPKWCKEFLRDVLETLIPQPLIKHNGPSTMTVTVNEQKEKGRYIIHILHYIPNKIADEILTIEDVIPLYNIKLSVCLPHAVNGVTLVPDKEQLDYEIFQNNEISFTVPKISGHCMIELSYK